MSMKFFHETVTSTCTKKCFHRNTHRTDFVGHARANKSFNIISNGITFQDGACINICDDSLRLKSLAKELMSVQGDNFFLNEYPEECEHKLFIDIDAKISDYGLQNIITALDEVTNNADVKVLRNTVSGKVHMIVDVPMHSYRVSKRKQAALVWLSRYLYDCADLSDEFEEAEWYSDVFDTKASGIRSAFSAKVQDGELGGPGVYAPAGMDISKLTVNERLQIIADYSIFARVTGRWTQEAIDQIDAVEAELLDKATAVREGKYKVKSEYNAEAKTIKFLSSEYPVNGALLNTFIKLTPAKWAGARHWGIMLKQVKTAAALADDFDPKYFLHEWSARAATLYNEQGNNDRYARCQVDNGAGEALTWLRNMAARGFKPDPNLFRGDMGLAEIFAGRVGDTIKIVSADGTCYMWDESLSLWKHRNNKWLVMK
eukprot:TRINITY_DN171_c0_g1_i5.p1 TRINITY_DN171_c0_g1~~TRINITY_DN171_c0_g1_i5.p1  ORF type:complete len:430 (-),score=50.68 TRINITY_DN171_c0_g1_i5:3118-4407(-)